MSNPSNMSGSSLQSNVMVTRYDKYNRIVGHEYYHNRVTRYALIGLLKYLSGGFELISDTKNYTPQYVSVGGSGVSVNGNKWTDSSMSAASVLDVKLDNEISPYYAKYIRKSDKTSVYVTTNEAQESYLNNNYELDISSVSCAYWRNTDGSSTSNVYTSATPIPHLIDKSNNEIYRLAINNRTLHTSQDDDSIYQMRLRVVVPSTYYQKCNIKELGLFSKPSGSNAIARVILDKPISKSSGSDYLTIDWMITIKSVEAGSSDDSDSPAYTGAKWYKMFRDSSGDQSSEIWK